MFGCRCWFLSFFIVVLVEFLLKFKVFGIGVVVFKLLGVVLRECYYGWCCFLVMRMEGDVGFWLR